MIYIIKINNENYYSGDRKFPVAYNMASAKRYMIRKYAESMAIKLALHYSFIKRAEIVMIEDERMGGYGQEQADTENQE